MPDTRSFSAPNLDLNHLATAIVDWYRGQNFKVQQINMQEGGILVQASQGGWRNAVGMASALNVGLRQNDTELTIEIGAGKWLDKAAVGAVSWFVLWPLAFAAAYGAWQQSQLPKRTFEFIQQYLAVNGSASGTVAVPSSSIVTPTPATSESSSTISVPPSGASQPSTTLSLRFCPNCGSGAAETDKFCSSCGFKLG